MPACALANVSICRSIASARLVRTNGRSTFHPANSRLNAWFPSIRLFAISFSICDSFVLSIRCLLGLSIRIVPHQLTHSYAAGMLRAGVGFPVLMKLLGHTNPEMTMRCVGVALIDL
jgi:site-specific recombinase XerD